MRHKVLRCPSMYTEFDINCVLIFQTFFYVVYVSYMYLWNDLMNYNAVLTPPQEAFSLHFVIKNQSGGFINSFMYSFILELLRISVKFMKQTMLAYDQCYGYNYSSNKIELI